MSQLLTGPKSDMPQDLASGGLLDQSFGWLCGRLAGIYQAVPGIHKKVPGAFLALLLVFSLVFVSAGLMTTFVRHALLPAQGGVFPWATLVTTDQDLGGASTLKIRQDTVRLDYEFLVTQKIQNPYATLVLSFAAGKEPGSFVDFSKYSQLSFRVRCSPQNVLTLVVHTFDDSVAGAPAGAAHPIPSRYFSCNQTSAPVTIDLHDLEIPDWWLQSMRMDLSKRDYSLKNVSGLAFAVSSQSPRDIYSDVVIEDLVLHGRDWRLFYFICALVLLVWAGIFLWHVPAQRPPRRAPAPDKSESQEVASESQEVADEPTVPAYQKVALEPQRDKQKNAILQFVATEYHNPAISLEMAAASLGINRNKINEILKQELALTFIAYLNKLRLTEAARLLTENETVNIAEVAYSVGYNNVPYFNKLFKGEYGCTPKVYKASAGLEQE